MSNANMGDEFRKFMMAGVGAIATFTEKSKEWIEEMSQKGETSAQSAQPMIDELIKKGEEVKGKVVEAFEGMRKEAQQWDMDDMSQSFNNMTDDALHTLRGKLDELIEYRKTQPKEEEQKACEGECNCDEAQPCEGECSEEKPCDCGCEEHQQNGETQG